jgi:hypothetical protein
MKFIILFLSINLNCYSQKRIDSIMSICDTMANRHCGEYNKLIYLKLDKKKLKKDLLYVEKFDKFLLNNIDSNFEFEKYKSQETIQNDSLFMYKVQVYYLNYIKVSLTLIQHNSKIYKGAVFSWSNSLFCGTYGESYVFDPRIAKLIIKNLKSNYSFLGCGAFYLNYYPDGQYFVNRRSKIKIPSKITQNLIDCNKIISEIIH